MNGQRQEEIYRVYVRRRSGPAQLGERREWQKMCYLVTQYLLVLTAAAMLQINNWPRWSCVWPAGNSHTSTQIDCLPVEICTFDTFFKINKTLTVSYWRLAGNIMKYKIWNSLYWSQMCILTLVQYMILAVLVKILKFSRSILHWGPSELIRVASGQWSRCS